MKFKTYVLTVLFIASNGIVQADEVSDDESVYLLDSIQPKSIMFENNPFYNAIDTQPIIESDSFKNDTLELPAKSVHGKGNDSLGKAFKKYWAKVEEQDGFDKLRNQMRSNDIIKSRLPRFYLFDSNLVIFPFPPVFIWGKKDLKKN
ncbi:MAG: hypothetical protein M3Y08_17400 [Fibrobacterota bacterium]|nr:hypothetical protein [Fibrobacterota bacterium]